MNTATILDPIAVREAATSAAREESREQMSMLAAEVAAIECELANLTTTRWVLVKILVNEVTACGSGRHQRAS